jgi:hypothetical protein
MNETQSMLIDLLTELLKTNKGEIKIANPEAIYEIARLQGLGAIVISVLNRHFENEFTKELDNVMRRTSMYNIMRIQQIKWLLEEFNKEDISTIVLKGLAIARFYENPEMRLMSDFDILVEEKDWERAINLLHKLGYNQVREVDTHPIHTSFFKEGLIFVELHRGLIRPDVFGESGVVDWYKHIWDNKQIESIETMSLITMSVEDEIINQIIHFACHLIYEGAVLKHIFEIALIMNSCGKKLDWDYIAKTLKTLEFYEFGKLIFSVCNIFFCVSVPDEFTKVEYITSEQFMNDFLNDYSQEKTNGDIKGWLKILTKFSFVYQNPILYPIAWSVELFVQFKLHRLQPIFAIKNSCRNIRIFNKKIKLIKQFKLIKVKIVYWR